jgi:hypothetical protein
MTRRDRLVGIAAGLLTLAFVAGLTTGGPLLAHAGPLAFLGEQTRPALDRVLPAEPAPELPAVGSIAASRYALTDIPSTYLALYVQADRRMQRSCPRLRWQQLAGIGKVESDHGRSRAPGVRSGVNRHGCCAGPMQFNLRSGPPSTWEAFKRPGDSVYDPADAIPAAARKLCANGLTEPARSGADPCPQVRGSPAEHRALKRYNDACWYVHQVLVLADRYTRQEPPEVAARDPFVRALTHNPRLTTTTARGCDPASDFASGRLDLRVQALLAALAERHTIRLSCLRTGHSVYVKGTRRVSNHTVWRAIDIDQIDGQPVGRRSRAARALVGWLDRLDGPLRPGEVGSPFRLGGRPFFTDEGHQGHVHVGYGGPALGGG